MLYIIVKKGNLVVKGVPFEKERFSLGRSPECDIILNDPLVSRKHAILKKEGNEIIVEDTGSKNGTFVNGKRISSVRLEEGDEIGIGFFKIEIKELREVPDERTRELKREVLGGEELKDLEVYIYRDALTGLYSRKFFEDEIMKWREEVYPLGVLFMDIDDFKKFNDTYGHRAGDLLLNSIGDFLIRNFPSGFPLRWGGEEFLVFLKNTPLEKAKEIAENLREKFVRFVIEKVGFHVTVSIGVSCIPENACSIEEAIEKADRAMYRAKAKGKNRVAIYENRQI